MEFLTKGSGVLCLKISLFCREASELRQLLNEGVAPKPPRFWSAKPGHPDVSDEDEEVLTEELLLCWRPEPGSPVRERVSTHRKARRFPHE